MMLCCDQLFFQQLWLVHFDPRWSAVARLFCCYAFWSWASMLLEFLLHYPCWCCYMNCVFDPARVVMRVMINKFSLQWDNEKREKRYVYDTFTILDRKSVDDFLQHLNNQQPSFRFTITVKKGFLPVSQLITLVLA